MKIHLFRRIASLIIADIAICHSKRGGERITRDELKEQIDELMRQYADEEIDGDTYFQKMMELTTSARDENND